VRVYRFHHQCKRLIRGLSQGIFWSPEDVPARRAEYSKPRPLGPFRLATGPSQPGWFTLLGRARGTRTHIDAELESAASSSWARAPCPRQGSNLRITCSSGRLLFRLGYVDMPTCTGIRTRTPSARHSFGGPPESGKVSASATFRHTDRPRRQQDSDLHGPCTRDLRRVQAASPHQWVPPALRVASRAGATPLLGGSVDPGHQPAAPDPARR
jgi:hypothetical protein